jgi:hypothetical protein
MIQMLYEVLVDTNFFRFSSMIDYKWIDTSLEANMQVI